MRGALINPSSGEVENIIELPDDYDSESEGSYSPPPGLDLVKDVNGHAVIGGKFKDNQWELPPLVVVEPAPEEGPTITERLEAVESELSAMKQRASETDVSNPEIAKVVDILIGE